MRKFLVLFSVILNVVTFGQDFNAPTVPLEVLAQGRQSVIANLIGRIDRVELTYEGRSVVGDSVQVIQHEQLKALGAKHAGSFSELSDALAGIYYSSKVIPTPEGQFDVHVGVRYLTSAGSVAFMGYGYLDITEGPDGELTAGKFRPSVWLNPAVVFETATIVTAARWTARNQGSIDLAVNYRYGSDGTVVTTVTFPTASLGEGYLAVTDVTGEVFALDLKTGQAVHARSVFALLGQTTSSDIRVLRNPASLDLPGYSFYASGGQIYGRVPLTELVLDQLTRVSFTASIPIWGTEKKIVPSQVFVTPIVFRDLNGNDIPDTLIGKRVEYPYGYTFDLPPGGYHVEIFYNGVHDYSADPDGGKKG